MNKEKRRKTELLKRMSPCFSFAGVVFFIIIASSSCSSPTPRPWPHQFHSTVFTNLSGSLQIDDLWYDWPNGRNLNIQQDQLGTLCHNIEWSNGTSFFVFPLQQPPTCFVAHFDVGILRPNWMQGANYLGRRSIDGFLCNVWEKADFFIQYYEDVYTKRLVHWLLFTGRTSEIMTFDVGAVLEDSMWLAPSYCFSNSTPVTTAIPPQLLQKQLLLLELKQQTRGPLFQTI